MTELKQAKKPMVAVKPKENISASKDSQAEVLNLIKSMQKTIDSMQSEREMLISVADKKQMAQWYSRHQTAIPKEVRLRKIAGKIILGWRTTRDEVYQDPVTQRWVEAQELEVIFDDGTTGKYNLRDFNRLYTQEKAKIAQKMVDEATGDVALKVISLESGKEYNIDVRFVN